MPRLFVDADLEEGARIAVNAGQARYLSEVMRLKPGAVVHTFNGRDGEHAAQLASVDRRGAVLIVAARTRPQHAPPDLWLLFSPLKRQATDWLVEKATELGVAALHPLTMRRTIAESVRIERMSAIAREAAEQTERLDIPEIAEPQKLANALSAWNGARALLYCDEQGEGEPLLEALERTRFPKQLALLIGPEGGFDPDERRTLRLHEFVTPVSLGPRILRAETAATAALAVIQARWGDWSAGVNL